jgi:hypothetical protein
MLNNIAYEYEGYAFILNNKQYIPDFYIPDNNCFLEVKGFFYPGARNKLLLFRENYPKVPFLLLSWVINAAFRGKIRMSRKLRITESSIVELSTAEKAGNPEAIAWEHLNIQSKKDTVPITFPRASGLHIACMRQHVLGEIFKLNNTRWTDINSSVVLAMGTAIHTAAQNTDLFFGDNRWGFWKCAACESKTPFQQVPYEPCKCGAKIENYKYYEFGARIKKPLMFSFHIDMFIGVKSCCNISALRVVELKTIREDAFLALKAPLAEHVTQVTAYLLGMQEFVNRADDFSPLKKIDVQFAYVLYICKKHLGKQSPVKMFLINVTPMHKKAVQDKLLLFKNGVENFPAALPPCDQRCKPPYFISSIAKKCPALERCKEYPY